MGAHNMWIYAKNQPIAEVSLSVAEAQCAEGGSVNTCDMWHTCRVRSVFAPLQRVSLCTGLHTQRSQSQQVLDLNAQQGLADRAADGSLLQARKQAAKAPASDLHPLCQMPPCGRCCAHHAPHDNKLSRAGSYNHACLGCPSHAAGQQERGHARETLWLQAGVSLPRAAGS